MRYLFNKFYSTIIYFSDHFDKKYYFFIFFIVLPLAILKYTDGWGDNALYLNQAVHLINGNLKDLYGVNKFVASQHDPNVMIYGPHLYPLGFSYLLLPAVYFFGINLLAIKIYLLIFWILAIVFLKKNLSLLFPDQNKVINLTVLFTLVGYGMLSAINGVYSDIYFFCFFNIWLYYNLNKKLQNNIFHLIVNGSILFFAYMIRTTGIVLFLSYIVFHLYYFNDLRKKYFKQLIPVIIFIGYYFIYKYLYPYDFGSNSLEYIKNTIGVDTILYNIFYQYPKAVFLQYYFNFNYYFLIFIKKNRNPYSLYSPIYIWFVFFYFNILVNIFFKKYKNKIFITA